MKKRKIKLLIFVLGLIIIDQAFKFLVVNFLNNNVIIVIKNFLKFIYVQNTGAAFGILSGNILFLIIISIGLIYYIIKEINSNNNSKIILSYSLVLSGALGNLIDRIFRGYVIDFISFTLLKKEMAVFNIADTYITIGVVLLIFFVIKEFYNERNSDK
jgi:signal peptidase II